MANAKNVKIEVNLNVMGILDAAGQAKFDSFVEADMVKYHNIPVDKASDAFDAAKVIRDFMAQTVSPFFGLKITFADNIVKGTNSVDGVVFYNKGTIEGTESVSWGYLNILIDAMKLWTPDGQVVQNVKEL